MFFPAPFPWQQRSANDFGGWGEKKSGGMVVFSLRLQQHKNVRPRFHFIIILLLSLTLPYTHKKFS